MSDEIGGKYEKKRDPVRTVYGESGEKKEVKISELCQYCPHFDCPGCYRKDAGHACLTMRSWREGEIELEEAIDAKYYQHSRHERTDELRDKVFHQIMRQQYEESYEVKSAAGDFASLVLKGVNPFVARKKFLGKPVKIPRGLAKSIKKRVEAELGEDFWREDNEG